MDTKRKVTVYTKLLQFFINTIYITMLLLNYVSSLNSTSDSSDDKDTRLIYYTSKLVISQVVFCCLAILYIINIKKNIKNGSMIIVSL